MYQFAPHLLLNIRQSTESRISVMSTTALTATFLAAAVCEHCTAQMAPRMRRMVQTPLLVLPERSASSSHTLVRSRPNCNHESHIVATALPRHCTSSCLLGSYLRLHSMSKASCPLYSRPSNTTANQSQSKTYSKPSQETCRLLQHLHT